VFDEVVRDELLQADRCESQVVALERVAVQQYLAQHLEAGRGPEA